MMTLCGRVSLTGVSLRLRAVSKAEGRSCAPGGIVFLLGLPWGVLEGLRKLLVLTGVAGRADASPWPLSLPPGKKLDMKLAMVNAMSTASWEAERNAEVTGKG